jgi:hypothetical protein
VKELLRSVIEHTEVDRIVILDPHAADHHLRQGIREVPTERHVEATETIMGELEGVSGLGVASIARRGMMDGFEAWFIPNHCKQEEHDEM